MTAPVELLDAAACDSAADALADLTRLLVLPGADKVLRICLKRNPAETLAEFIPELVWELRAQGFEPFEGSELGAGAVRLGPFDPSRWEHVQPDPARGFLCDPDVWPLLAAAFANPCRGDQS